MFVIFHTLNNFFLLTSQHTNLQYTSQCCSIPGLESDSSPEIEDLRLNLNLRTDDLHLDLDWSIHCIQSQKLETWTQTFYNRPQ